jgi:hypothetical protein
MIHTNVMTLRSYNILKYYFRNKFQTRHNNNNIDNLEKGQGTGNLIPH